MVGQPQRQRHQRKRRIGTSARRIDRATRYIEALARPWTFSVVSTTLASASVPCVTTHRVEGIRRLRTNAFEQTWCPLEPRTPDRIEVLLDDVSKLCRRAVLGVADAPIHDRLRQAQASRYWPTRRMQFLRHPRLLHVDVHPDRRASGQWRAVSLIFDDQSRLATSPMPRSIGIRLRVSASFNRPFCTEARRFRTAPMPESSGAGMMKCAPSPQPVRHRTAEPRQLRSSA